MLETGRRDRGCVCLWIRQRSVPRKSGRASRSVHLCELPPGGAAWPSSSVSKYKNGFRCFEVYAVLRNTLILINTDDKKTQ